MSVAAGVKKVDICLDSGRRRKHRTPGILVWRMARRRLRSRACKAVDVIPVPPDSPCLNHKIGYKHYHACLFFEGVLLLQ